MKLLSASQVREADAYTITHEPISSTDLMERAAGACYEWLINNTLRLIKSERDNGADIRNEPVKVFCGTGNNGGDGLVIARKLHENGSDVVAYVVRFSNKCSDDFLVNEQRLQNTGIDIKEIRTEADIPQIQATDLVIDAIFGTGLTRPVEGIAAAVIKAINQSKAMVIAIDIPSGLFSEDNANNNREHIIEADHTLTFEIPKLAFMFPENARFVGSWHLLPIGLDREFISRLPSTNYFVTREMAASIIVPRGKFSHKGNYGHALLLAGSYGKMGAAVLAAEACLRAGAGLVSVHVPKCGNTILHTAVPEAMLSMDGHEEHLTEQPPLEQYSAIGLGPGLGMQRQTQAVVKLMIQNSRIPLVIDADGINIIAENKTWYSFVPKGSIFTPHPKEFERLAGQSSDHYRRFQMQLEFAGKYGVYVILKGANTAIACPDGEVYFNSTGNPGMATAGSGDVLTGIITGLSAQGYDRKQACVLGVYLHGLAGDLAADKKGPDAMIAGDVIDNMGEAYKILKDTG